MQEIPPPRGVPRDLCQDGFHCAHYAAAGVYGQRLDRRICEIDVQPGVLSVMVNAFEGQLE